MMKFVGRLSRRNGNARSERPVLMACIGDSVTHGCFELIVDANGDYVPVYRSEKGYVSGVERRLRALYPAAAVTVLNAGISGDSSRGGLARIERDVLSFSPDLVTVNFGLNDSMSADTERGVEAYRKNMRAMFEKILASGAEAMLVTPNFMCSYVPSTVQGEGLRGTAARAAQVQNEGILKRYVDAAREIAREMNVPAADAYARWERMAACGVDTTALLSNGINHPAEEMHAIFEEEIIRAMFEA